MYVISSLNFSTETDFPADDMTGYGYTELVANESSYPTITIGDGMSIESELKRIADNGANLSNIILEKDMKPDLSIPDGALKVENLLTIEPTPINNNITVEPTPIQNSIEPTPIQNNITVPDSAISVNVTQDSPTVNVQAPTVNNQVNPTPINNNITVPDSAISVNVTQDSPTVNNTVNVDTSSLATANETIANAMSSQKQYHDIQIEKADKQIEEMDFYKNGSETLKDSNGEVIKPREAKAIHNAEKAIETKDMNSTTVGELWDDLKEGLGYAVGEGLEYLGDFGDFGGGSMGENGVNPLEYLINQVKDDEQNRLNQFKENLND